MLNNPKDYNVYIICVLASSPMSVVLITSPHPSRLYTDFGLMNVKIFIPLYSSSKSSTPPSTFLPASNTYHHTIVLILARKTIAYWPFHHIGHHLTRHHSQSPYLTCGILYPETVGTCLHSKINSLITSLSEILQLVR